MAHLAHLAHRLDRTSRGSALVASLLAVAVVSLATSGFAGDSKDAGPCDPSSEPWIYPAEAVDTTDPVSWARFAWDGFVALNWPQLEGGAPGEPDTSVTICDQPSGRPAFLQWMQKEQLLLPDGASPGTWDNPTFSTPMFTPEDGGPTLPLLGALSMTTDPDLVDEFDEAFSHRPLLDQNGRYVLFQIFLNRSEFERLLRRGESICRVPTGRRIRRIPCDRSAGGLRSADRSSGVGAAGGRRTEGFLEAARRGGDRQRSVLHAGRLLRQ